MSKRKWSKEDIQEFRKIHGSPFYYNKDDSNLFVPKAYGIGRTINWANPIAWVVAFTIIAFIILRAFLKK